MSKQLSYYHENKVRIAKKLKEKYANDKEFREEKKRIAKRQQKNPVPLRKNEKIIPDDERKKYDGGFGKSPPIVSEKKIKKKRPKCLMPCPPSQEWLDWCWSENGNEPSQGLITHRWIY
jgi:hypothetical protein